MLDALHYLADNGIKWRAMPVDFPPWDRVYAFFRHWRDHGLVKAVPRPAARTAKHGPITGCPTCLRAHRSLTWSVWQRDLGGRCRCCPADSAWSAAAGPSLGTQVLPSRRRRPCDWPGAWSPTVSAANMP
ncbi:transposase [Streptomyces sp. NPDC059649]|uniref:transposase n=1 Tax=Streptomyces sp. NPDC059649 TaxID=3346895 RepID=UPI003695A1E3